MARFVEPEIKQKKSMKINLKPDTHYKAYVCFILAISAFYFLKWPIEAHDTDLWRNFNYARHFITHGEILKDNAYSFISPEREFVNYAWLYQVFIYPVFEVSGYYGLLILRTIVFLITLFFLFPLFYRHKQVAGPPLLIFLYLLLLVDRGLDVRPYNFSFLFMVLFLYVLELKPEKVKYLPILAVIWNNVHGIYFPVLLLICMSYIAECSVRRLKEGRQFSKRETGYVLSLTICMASIFLTPHTWKLLVLPFEPVKYTSLYVNEHAPFNFFNLFDLHFNGLVPTYQTIYNVFIFITCFVFIVQCCKRRIKLCHLFLFMGGLYLLSREIRFVYEFSILAAPLLGMDAFVHTSDKQLNMPLPAYIVTYGLIIVMPVLYFQKLIGNPPHYPMSRAGLPYGVTAFLKHVNVKANVLNTPDHGGYFQWALAPDYNMFMDLHVPHFFSDEEFFIANSSIYNEASLKKFISTYDPGFITLPRTLFHKQVIRNLNDYNVVFFDDSEVLYVDTHQFPEIAEQYRLLKTDPFILDSVPRESLTDSSGMLEELSDMAGIYPHCRTVNRTICLLFYQRRAYDRAVLFADKLIDDFPNMFDGYRLKGDCLSAQGLFSESLDYYKEALDKNADNQKGIIYRKIWDCYTKLNQHEEAYVSMKKAVNVFSPTTTYEDLYRISFSALKTNRIREAVMLTKFAYFKIPDNEPKWKMQIEKQLAVLEENSAGMNTGRVYELPGLD